MNSQPSSLVRKLIVAGGGSFDGDPFSFAGAVEALTGQPSVYGKPATVNIKTNGSIGMLLQAALDHPAELAEDRIVINCSELKQPGRLRGSPDRFVRQVDPGSSALQMELDLSGDDLNGVIRFNQPLVNMRVVVSDKLGGQLVSNRLSTTTTAIGDLQATVQLGGTLNRPIWKLDSNVGRQLANGWQTAFTNEMAPRQEQLIARANEEIDAQIVKLHNKIVKQQYDLLGRLNLENEELNLLTNEIASLDITDKISDKLLGEKGLLKSLFRR